MPSYEWNYYRGITTFAASGGASFEVWHTGHPYMKDVMAAVTMTTNVLYARPFLVTVRTWTVDRAGVFAVTGDSGCAYKVGLYTTYGVGCLYPNALLYSTTVPMSGADPGIVLCVSAISSVFLPPDQLYWAAIVTSRSAGPQVYGEKTTFGTMLLGTDLSGNSTETWTLTYSYNLPATFPSGATRGLTPNYPSTLWRFAG